MARLTEGGELPARGRTVVQRVRIEHARVRIDLPRQAAMRQTRSLNCIGKLSRNKLGAGHTGRTRETATELSTESDPECVHVITQE